MLNRVNLSCLTYTHCEIILTWKRYVNILLNQDGYWISTHSFIHYGRYISRRKWHVSFLGVQILQIHFWCNFFFLTGHNSQCLGRWVIYCNSWQSISGSKHRTIKQILRGMFDGFQDLQQCWGRGQRKGSHCRLPTERLKMDQTKLLLLLYCYFNIDSLTSDI